MKNLLLLVSLPVFSPPTPSETYWILLSHNPTYKPTPFQRRHYLNYSCTRSTQMCRGLSPRHTCPAYADVLQAAALLTAQNWDVTFCALWAVQVQEHSSMPLIWKARWKLTFTFLTLFFLPFFSIFAAGGMLLSLLLADYCFTQDALYKPALPFLSLTTVLQAHWNSCLEVFLFFPLSWSTW